MKAYLAPGLRTNPNSQLNEASAMETNETKKLVEALERSLTCNILLVDAIFELLAKKEILSRDEVIDYVRRLRLESSRHTNRVH